MKSNIKNDSNVDNKFNEKLGIDSNNNNKDIKNSYQESNKINEDDNINNDSQIAELNVNTDLNIFKPSNNNNNKNQYMTKENISSNSNYNKESERTRFNNNFSSNSSNMNFNFKDYSNKNKRQDDYFNSIPHNNANKPNNMINNLFHPNNKINNNNNNNNNIILNFHNTNSTNVNTFFEESYKEFPLYSTNLNHSHPHFFLNINQIYNNPLLTYLSLKYTCKEYVNIIPEIEQIKCFWRRVYLDDNFILFSLKNKTHLNFKKREMNFLFNYQLYLLKVVRNVFYIKSLYVDFIGYFLIKIELVGNKPGEVLIKTNSLKDSSIRLRVVGKDKEMRRYITKQGIIHSLLDNVFEMREEDSLILYIMKEPIWKDEEFNSSIILEY